jgi:hypothetical protein
MVPLSSSTFGGGVARNTSLHAARSSSSGLGVELRAGAEFDRLMPLPYPPRDSMDVKWMNPHFDGVSTRGGEGSKLSWLEQSFLRGMGDTMAPYMSGEFIVPESRGLSSSSSSKLHPTLSLPLAARERAWQCNRWRAALRRKLWRCRVRGSARRLIAAVRRLLSSRSPSPGMLSYFWRPPEIA